MVPSTLPPVDPSSLLVYNYIYKYVCICAFNHNRLLSPATHCTKLLLSLSLSLTLFCMKLWIYTREIPQSLMEYLQSQSWLFMRLFFSWVLCVSMIVYAGCGWACHSRISGILCATPLRFPLCGLVHQIVQSEEHGNVTNGLILISWVVFIVNTGCLNVSLEAVE